MKRKCAALEARLKQKGKEGKTAIRKPARAGPCPADSDEDLELQLCAIEGRISMINDAKELGSGAGVMKLVDELNSAKDEMTRELLEIGRAYKDAQDQIQHLEQALRSKDKQTEELTRLYA